MCQQHPPKLRRCILSPPRLPISAAASWAHPSAQAQILPRLGCDFFIRHCHEQDHILIRQEYRLLHVGRSHAPGRMCVRVDCTLPRARAPRLFYGHLQLARVAIFGRLGSSEVTFRLRTSSQASACIRRVASLAAGCSRHTHHGGGLGCWPPINLVRMIL